MVQAVPLKTSRLPSEPMRLHADSYFCIGGSHASAGNPCQDYATTDVLGSTTARAVVCDGCSTGGRTDVGARLLAHTALHWPPEVCGSAPNEDVRGAATRVFGLSKQDLLATRLYLSISDERSFWRIHGDGAVAIRRRSGDIWMAKYEWADNTPFYPIYTEADQKRFIEVHGGNLEADRFLVSVQVRPSEGGVSVTREFNYTLREGMRGINRFIAFDEGAKIDCIALFSDGVTQIDGVDWREAIAELMSFKNTAGEFVKRRAMAAMRKFREKGKGPIDDFAMAAIWVDHE